MKNRQNTTVISAMIISIFVWIGFIGGISFMEAWLKFRAPGVSLTVGLGIGKLVFGALNKVEFGLMMVILFCLWRLRPVAYLDFIVFLPIFILLIQVFVLMPVLDSRADAYIQGQNVPPSSTHLYYVIGEGVKMICLWWAGLRILRQAINSNRP